MNVEQPATMLYTVYNFADMYTYMMYVRKAIHAHPYVVCDTYM